MNRNELNTLKEISSFQNAELKKLLQYLETNSPFYKELFRKHNINLSEINSIADLSKIPVTTKADLQNRNPDFLCVDPSLLIDYCSTSGTLGTPVTIALTENDLQRLALNEYLSFKSAGASKNDIIHLMLSLDRQFMAGVAYFLGARMMGAGIIRGGPGNISMHLDTIHRIHPTILVAVPSFIVSLIGYAFENNIDLNKTSVKKIICIGENIRNDDFTLNAIGERITKNWNVELFSTYASTEQQTAFTECSCGNGGHHQPQLLIFEVLDENDNPLPPGESGELTITTLGVEGMPLLRYKTGDLCTYYTDKCDCGLITSRISPVKGRKQHLIKFKGTTLYPQTIFNALNAIVEVNDFVVKLFTNDMGLDDLELNLSVDGEPKEVDKEIRHLLQSKLRIVPSIRYQSLENIQKMQVAEGKRKINKLIDERASK